MASGKDGGYDTNLLAQAPQVSRNQRQEGYNVDILNPSSSANVSREELTPPPAAIPASTQGHEDPERGYVGKEAYAASARKTSFWRTGKGKLTLGAIALIIIAAVVGGAVGGTSGKSKKNTNENSGGGSTSPAQSGPAAPTGNDHSSSQTPASSDTQGVGGGNSHTPTASVSAVSTTSPAGGETATVPGPSPTTTTGGSEGGGGHLGGGDGLGGGEGVVAIAAPTQSAINNVD